MRTHCYKGGERYFLATRMSSAASSVFNDIYNHATPQCHNRNFHGNEGEKVTIKAFQWDPREELTEPITLSVVDLSNGDIIYQSK